MHCHEIMPLCFPPCSHRCHKCPFPSQYWTSWWRRGRTGVHDGGQPCLPAHAPRYCTINQGSVPDRMAAVRQILSRAQTVSTPPLRAKLVQVRCYSVQISLLENHKNLPQLPSVLSDPDRLPRPLTILLPLPHLCYERYT